VLVALQFITNPLTLVPIYAFTGWVGVVLMRATSVGNNLPAAMYYAQALFIGGVVVGLAVGAVADLIWRVAAWEARRFSARLAQSRKRLDPP
jgi:uncharacterized protein (DUF2062 family)